jgi:GT2 family glycosyltransferase
VTQDVPLVSFIIVNYRTYEELDVCLSSLAQQRNGRLEGTVVDQGADEDAVRELSKRYPWCRFVPMATNQGFAAGVNRGASVSAGKYLLLLNSDCVVRAGLWQTLAEWLDHHSDVAAVGPRIRNEDGTVQQSARHFPDITTVIGGRTSLLTRILPGNWFTRRNLLVADDAPEPIRVDWVSGACLMVRRTAYVAVGGMDEGFFMYWEDADLCRRLKDAGWSTVYHPVAEVLHLGGRASSYSVERSLVAFHLSAYRYVRKHGGIFSRALAPVALAGLEARLALKLAWRRAAQQR